MELLVQKEHIERASEQLPSNVPPWSPDGWPVDQSGNIDREGENAGLPDIDPPSMPEEMNRAIPRAMRLGRFPTAFQRSPSRAVRIINNPLDFSPPFAQTWIIGAVDLPRPQCILIDGYENFFALLPKNLTNRSRINRLSFFNLSNPRLIDIFSFVVQWLDVVSFEHVKDAGH
jgi:hypothetical protein